MISVPHEVGPGNGEKVLFGGAQTAASGVHWQQVFQVLRVVP